MFIRGSRCSASKRGELRRAVGLGDEEEAGSHLGARITDVGAVMNVQSHACFSPPTDGRKLQTFIEWPPPFLILQGIFLMHLRGKPLTLRSKKCICSSRVWLHFSCSESQRSRKTGWWFRSICSSFNKSEKLRLEEEIQLRLSVWSCFIRNNSWRITGDSLRVDYTRN